MKVAWSGQGHMPANAVLVFGNDAQTPVQCVRVVHAETQAAVVCAGWAAPAGPGEQDDLQLPPWMLHTLGAAQGAETLHCEALDVPETPATLVDLVPLGAYPRPVTPTAHELPQMVRDNTLNLAEAVTRQIEYVAVGSVVCVVLLGTQYLFRVSRITAGEATPAVARLGRHTTSVELVSQAAIGPTTDSKLSSAWSAHPWAIAVAAAGFAGYEDLVNDVAFHLRLVLVEASAYVAAHGLLIRGVRGVGKSLLLQALAASLAAVRVPVIHLEGMALALEATVNTAFPSPSAFLAHKLRGLSAGVLLLDNADALFEENEVSPLGRSLLHVLDGLANRRVVVVATVTEPLPGAATRVGRFERSFDLAVPTETVRAAVLARRLASTALDAPVADVARRAAAATGGYVPKDLARLCRHALAASKHRGAAIVAWQDFVKALGSTSPSQLQSLNVQSPASALAAWTQFAGYVRLKERLLELISYRFERKEALAALGVQSVSGILLYGPSGCGKTTLVRGLAAKCNANFVRVQSSDLMSKYFGETEKAIRDLFARARSSAPCILFFDELDSIAEKRAFGGSGGGGSSSVYARVLSTLLNEMDGVGGQTAEVIVMAATNRKDALDAALVRPGRIDQALHAIFASYTARMPLAADVDLRALAATTFDLSRDLSKMQRAAQMTGADIGAICKTAAFNALRANEGAAVVAMAHFTAAITARLERV
ncbi:cell division cycle protein 48 [Achlya hypogyna]|uniref:Cell division cycle protein 48 n=1 Tax=Achlya hypogyna TaxID=1202772 RepID=A0A1V9YK99_ACHHY|nr:cell division cycle protein 48 [Achlya hypogyna]